MSKCKFSVSLLLDIDGDDWGDVHRAVRRVMKNPIITLKSLSIHEKSR